MEKCNNVYSLGFFDSCKKIIDTNLTADVLGIYTVEIDYLGITEIKKITVLTVGTIKIINNLNEDFEYIMRIYKPNGSLLNNTCYSFKIYPVTCK